jgi:Bacterial regulatory proteins, luxR family
VVADLQQSARTNRTGRVPLLLDSDRVERSNLEAIEEHIASRLGVSEHTVTFHVASIMGKLGAASRTEAVMLGIRRGLVLI